MASELRHLLTNMGDKLSDEDFKDLLEELDIDSNGRIQFAGRNDIIEYDLYINQNTPHFNICCTIVITIWLDCN